MRQRVDAHAGTPHVLGVAVEQGSWLAMELVEAVEAAAAEAGMDVRRVSDADGERGVETLLAIGHPWMYPDLLRRPRSARRILWYGEWLPPPDSNGGAPAPSLFSRLRHGRRIDATARRVLDWLIAATGDGRAPAIERTLLAVKERAAMEREGARHLAELAAGAAAYDEVVVTSRDKVAGAARAGLRTRVVLFGYHPVLCGPLVDAASGLRDIDVLFFGSLATRGFRRGRILDEIARSAGCDVRVVHGGVQGADRHGLLRRVRVVLDIHRIPGNRAALRWMHATAAGAAFVTEPFADSLPLEAGVHFVQSEPQGLGAAAGALVLDEPRRREIVARGQALLRSTLHMRASLGHLLAAQGPSPARAPAGVGFAQ